MEYSKEYQLRGHQKQKDKPKFKQQTYKEKKPKSKRHYTNKPNTKPSMTERKKFKKEVILEAIERFNGLCGNCQARPPYDPHHIRYRSDGGKGVITNCLPVCRSCHNEIHRSAELTMYWKNWAKEQYGFDYWMDEWDKDSMKYELYQREGN